MQGPPPPHTHTSHKPPHLPPLTYTHTHTHDTLLTGVDWVAFLLVDHAHHPNAEGAHHAQGEAGLGLGVRLVGIVYDHRLHAQEERLHHKAVP